MRGQVLLLLGVICETFKKTFKATLWRAVKGSKVVTLCHEATSPTIAP